MKAVLSVFGEKNSTTGVAKEYSIAEPTLQYWLRKY